MLNGEREVAWFWLLHAILLTIFVASLVLYPRKKSSEIASPSEIDFSQIAILSRQCYRQVPPAFMPV